MSKFIFSRELLNYRFNDKHPFNQMRVLLTMDLLRAMHQLDDDDIVPGRMATDEELALVHTTDYIDAVKRASRNELPDELCENYGLNTQDTPNFPEMHESSAYLVGATLTACDIVMSGTDRYACNIGGGLHHGFSGRASGFCIYNDSAVAIQYMKERYNARVLYVDSDAHHGDGVQFSFYNDDQVFTFSIHETGRYLFPGTGGINEKGEGHGYLYSMNLPVDAYTEDASFLHCFEQGLKTACAFFKPDVIISQNGADAHYLDPLTHLHCTHQTFAQIPRIVKQMADQYCEGRWVAVGGGGYNVFQVAPLAWSQIWLAMNNVGAPSGSLPEEWLNKWQPKTSLTLPATWESDLDGCMSIPRRAEITEKNEHMLQRVLQHYST